VSDMGFYIKAEYELMIIFVVIVLAVALIRWLVGKCINYKRRRNCLSGAHVQYVTEDNYRYCFKKCSCGKEWTMTHKQGGW
jgi:hypothetical protein